MKNYEKNLQNVRNGFMTEKEWKDYCYSILIQLMEENADVLLRLKNI